MKMPPNIKKKLGCGRALIVWGLKGKAKGVLAMKKVKRFGKKDDLQGGKQKKSKYRKNKTMKGTI